MDLGFGSFRGLEFTCVLGWDFGTFLVVTFFRGVNARGTIIPYNVGVGPIDECVGRFYYDFWKGLVFFVVPFCIRFILCGLLRVGVFFGFGASVLWGYFFVFSSNVGIEVTPHRDSNVVSDPLIVTLGHFWGQRTQGRFFNYGAHGLYGASHRFF